MDRWDHGVWGVASTCTMFATSPETLYLCVCWLVLLRRVFYLVFWFICLVVPGISSGQSQCLIYDSDAVTMMLGSILSGYILALDGLGI